MLYSHTRGFRAWSAASLVLVALLFYPLGVVAQTGTLSGTVVDAVSGESLIGVNVTAYVADSETLVGGAATDLEGRYRIGGLDAGRYDLLVSYVGFNSQRVTGIDLAAGATETLNVALEDETLEVGEARVEARLLRNTDTALLRDRQRSAAVSDAVSAETISRSGAGNAADALQKVPGASLVGGKYLVVRGLSDRYLNTQLNGATLPSADPERNVAPLDLFPSGMLDNIVTSKSFTPDKPGDFTGGAVNLSTRAFPDKMTAQVSVSSGFNTQVEPGSDLLLFNGGSLGFFGQPEGELGLPGVVENMTEREVNTADADTRAAITNAFAPVVAPTVQTAPVTGGLSASLGNYAEVAGKPVGYIVGVNWSRSTNGYSEGVVRVFDAPSAGTISPQSELAVQLGEEEVLFGGLANLSVRPTEKSELGLNVLFNRNGTSQAIYQEGSLEDLQSQQNVYQARSLLYTERALASAQLRGTHALGEKGFRVEWNGTYSRTTLDEPDYRIFENEVSPAAEPGGDPDYLIRLSGYQTPRRIFRELGENGLSANLDVTAPLAERAGLPVKVKVGGAFNLRDRDFRERLFTIPINPSQQTLLDEFDGDPNALVAPQSVVDNRLFLIESTENNAAYDGQMTVGAGYVMSDVALTRRLRFIGGLRGEYTDLQVVSPFGALEGFSEAGYSDFSVLGSASVVFAATDRMNLRAAYGKTLARPTFREVAPRSAFSLAERYRFTGNPDLVQSDIHNADLRWEWFTGSGEIMAVSGFYKRFVNPIELTFDPRASGNDELIPANLGDADLFGLELEARRQLSMLPGPLANLQVGGNVTLVETAVELTPEEQEARFFGGATRPLQGQSPYVVNLDLAYLDYEQGTSVSLFYNVFGSRLYAVARGGVPDLYEEPRGILDLTISQEVVGGFSLKASAKNLLDESYRVVHAADELEERSVQREYALGRSFSLGITYGF